MDFLIALFFGREKSHVLCKNNSVWKIVNDELSKTIIRVLPYGTVWVDEPSPLVVSAVAFIELKVAKTTPNDQVQILFLTSFE